MADSKEFLLDLSKRLADEGKLIEAGWVSYRTLVVPLDAPPVQLEETRLAFYAGCQHLFSSIMATLDPDTEPTEADVNRLSLISAELNAFIGEFKKKHGL